jgi:small conductance mechanosensitive channel
VIHNRTKLYSRYIFETVLAYGSDLERALQILEEEGQALREDPDFKALITRPVEVLGVEKLSETGVVIRSRLTTQPKAFQSVGRAYNLRVAKAFAAVGLSSPYTTIQLMGEPGPTPLSQPAETPAERRSFDPPEIRPQT